MSNATSSPDRSKPQTDIDDILLHQVGVHPRQATDTQLMQAASLLARSQLSERWVNTQAHEREAKAQIGRAHV